MIPLRFFIRFRNHDVGPFRNRVDADWTWRVRFARAGKIVAE